MYVRTKDDEVKFSATKVIDDDKLYIHTNIDGFDNIVVYREYEAYRVRDKHWITD